VVKVNVSCSSLHYRLAWYSLAMVKNHRKVKIRTFKKVVPPVGELDRTMLMFLHFRLSLSNIPICITVRYMYFVLLHKIPTYYIQVCKID